MQILGTKNILGFLFLLLFFYCIGSTTTLYDFDKKNLLINNYTMILSLFIFIMFIVLINVFILSQNNISGQQILLYSFLLGIVISINSEFNYMCAKSLDKTLLNSLGIIFVETTGLILTSYLMYYLQ